MTKTVWNNSNWVNDDGDDDGFITTMTTKKNSATSTTKKKKKKKKKKKSNNATDVTTTTATTSPSDPITSNKYRALVIDSGPIIRFDTSTSSTMNNNVADKYYTTPSVMAEIKDAKARDHLSQLPYELKLRTPSSVSMNAIVNFARQTGDYASLSRVDLQVLALTYELEMEGCNGNITHIRTTKKKNNMTTTTTKNTSNASAVVIQQADKAGGGVNTDEIPQDDDDDEEETEVYVHDETKDVAIFASTTGEEEIEIVPEDHNKGGFTNFWNQYENISQKLSNLEQSVGINISPIKSQMELEEEEEKEEEGVESVGEEEEEESEEEVDPTTTATAAPKSWAMMVDPTASSVTETTTAFPKTKIVLPKQQQQQTVKSSFFDDAGHEEGSDGSNSAGQFSDAEEDEEDFAFQFDNLNNDSTQEKNENQVDRTGRTASGFQFNLLPPKQETTAGGSFRFNLLPPSPIQKGEEEEKNEYFVEEEEEDDEDDDFPTLTALTLDDDDDNNDDDEDVTPAILAKQRAEKNRLEALQSVSKSGKQYNSFRKYRDVIKPKVVRKEEEESEELSPLQNIVSDNEDDKPKDNRSRILGSTTGAIVMRQDEDDGEGWVTSKKDITKMKSMGRLNPRTDPSKIDASLLSNKKKLDKNPPTSMRTACATTDFAMQNVLLQMNLELVTPDGGMRITKLKSWVTRCGACFMVYPDNDLTKSLYRNMNKRLFCSRCGSGDMMQRIAASVNNTTGELRLHFSKKYRPNLRGTKFSLPANNSKNVDRYRGDLLLREDQLLMGSWNQKLLRSSKKNKESLFGCDLAEHVGCNSKQGSHTSLDGPIRVGFGRQNPNAAKGGRERRGKKKKGNTQSKACGLRRY